MKTPPRARFRASACSGFFSCSARLRSSFVSIAAWSEAAVGEESSDFLTEVADRISSLRRACSAKSFRSCFSASRNSLRFSNSSAFARMAETSRKAFKSRRKLPICAPCGEQVGGLFDCQRLLLNGSKLLSQENIITRFSLRFHRLHTKPGQRLVNHSCWSPFMASLKYLQPMSKRCFFELFLQRNYFAVVEVRVSHRGKHHELRLCGWLRGKREARTTENYASSTLANLRELRRNSRASRKSSEVDPLSVDGKTFLGISKHRVRSFQFGRPRPVAGIVGTPHDVPVDFSCGLAPSYRHLHTGPATQTT